MMSNNPSEAGRIKNLESAIGVYSSNPNGLENPKIANLNQVNKHLSKDEIQHLYEGTTEYQMKKTATVASLFPGAKPSDVDATFFRRQFLKHLDSILQRRDNNGPYFGIDSATPLSPKNATITLGAFLGERGKDLYKAALEEEYNSTEYRNAVFKASLMHIDGPSWKKAPVLIVSGPSASGKTFAAKHALAQASHILPKASNGDGNNVISIDGGICRSVSQMRKILVQLAVSKGFAGIEDLHKNSSILDNMKKHLSDAVLQNPNMGIVIPETFSEFLNPLAKIRENLQSWSNIPSKQLIFSRVDGADPESFRAVVEQQGNKRAWETQHFTRSRFDLNDDNIPESKAYGKMGFDFGQIGSKLAERSVMKANPKTPFLLIVNDMVLKKPDPNRAHFWLDAKPGDEGLVMVPKKIFARWELIESINGTLSQKNDANNSDIAKAEADLRTIRVCLQRAPSLEAKEDKDRILAKTAEIRDRYPSNTKFHELCNRAVGSLQELFAEPHTVDATIVKTSMEQSMAQNATPQQKLMAYAKLYSANKPTIEQTYRMQAEQIIKDDIAACVEKGQATLRALKKQYQQEYKGLANDSGLSQLQALETFLEIGCKVEEHHSKLIHQIWYLREQIGPKQGQMLILDEAYDTALLTLSSISELARPMASVASSSARNFKEALQELKHEGLESIQDEASIGHRSA